MLAVPPGIAVMCGGGETFDEEKELIAKAIELRLEFIEEENLTIADPDHVTPYPTQSLRSRRT